MSPPSAAVAPLLSAAGVAPLHVDSCSFEALGAGRAASSLVLHSLDTTAAVEIGERCHGELIAGRTSGVVSSLEAPIER